MAWKTGNVKRGTVSVNRRVPYETKYKNISKWVRKKPSPSGRRMVVRNMYKPSQPYYNSYVKPYYRGKAGAAKAVSKFTRNYSTRNESCSG